MNRSPIASVLMLTLGVLLASVDVAGTSCWGEGPEAVLRCFSAAYSDRDEVMLESVLAPDYVWVTVAPPQVDIFTREMSVESSVRMFGDPEVEWVSLEFDDGFRIVPGEDPSTWRIEDLRATLTVKAASIGEPRVAPLCVTLYVRSTGSTTPSYQVYREVFFEGDGCVGK